MNPMDKAPIVSCSFALQLALLLATPAGAADHQTPADPAKAAAEVPFGHLNPLWLNVYLMTGSPSVATQSE